MKITIVLFLLYLLLGAVKAQTNFTQRIGTNFKERAYCAIQTFDGNYLLAGITDGFGSDGNAFLIKVDINGNIIWSKDYPGINEDKIKDIIELSDHSLVMCGNTSSYGEGYDDAFVMKTDSVGNVLWAKTYGSSTYEFGQKIVPDGAGGYYFLIMNSAYCILRLDGLGNILWCQGADPFKPFTPLGIDIFKTDILALASGGVILGGNSNCRKFSSTGVYQWGYRYYSSAITSPSGTEDVSLAENSSGEIFFATSLANNLTNAPLSSDVFILKLNSSGNLIWSKSYGGTYSDKVMSILINDHNNLVINGVSNSAGNGYYDGFLMSIDQTGNLQWANAYGSIWQDAILNARTTNDGGYILAGESYAHNTVLDSVKAFIVKTDSVGNADCSVSWTPVVNIQPITVSVLDTPYYSPAFQKNSIPWIPVTRNFYTRDICNGVTGIEGNLLGNINIYPNPFIDKITIQVNELNSKKVKIGVKNLLGKMIYNYESFIDSDSYVKMIDLSSVCSGVYIIELDIEGNYSTYKILKH